MSGQQIDSLTIGVGLTQEDFQAGVQKILQSLGSLRTQTEATGESMTSSMSSIGGAVLSLGARFAGLFIAVKGIEDVVGYFKNLSQEFSKLSAAGEYLGVAGKELRLLGQVAVEAGGQTTDALTAVHGLQSAIFGLEFQGQMSQNLLMLQRLGVGYLDASGHMRDMKDIALETAKALQQTLPGKANEAMRVQWAAQIFGAGGLANAVGGGVAELRKFYADAAHAQKGITEKTLESQRQLQQNLVRLSNEVAADASAILTQLTPAINGLIDILRNSVVPVINEVISDILHPVDQFAKNHPMLGNAIDMFKNMGRMFEEPFMHGAIAAEKIPADVMARIPPPVADDPKALNVLKTFHFYAGGDAEDPNWSKAITNFLGFYPSTMDRGGFISRPHIGGVPAHALTTPSLPRPAAAGAGAGKPTAAAARRPVQIGSINIETQAKDANGIAASIDRALERQLLISQSDRGMA